MGLRLRALPPRRFTDDAVQRALERQVDQRWTNDRRRFSGPYAQRPCGLVLCDVANLLRNDGALGDRWSCRFATVDDFRVAWPVKRRRAVAGHQGPRPP